MEASGPKYLIVHTVEEDVPHKCAKHTVVARNCSPVEFYWVAKEAVVSLSNIIWEFRP